MTPPAVSDSNMLLHDRMVHPNKRFVTKIIRISQSGMKQIDKQHNGNCTTYVQTNHTKYPSNSILIQKSQDITIHANIRHPMQTTTYGDPKYSLILATAYRRNVIRYFLKIRSKIAEHYFYSMAWLNYKAKQNTKRIFSNKSAELLGIKTI